MAPDLSLSSANSLKVTGGGELSPQSAKQPASKQPLATPPAAPCQKDFWGNCAQPTVALLPSLIPPTPPPPPAAKPPPARGSRTTAAQCEKDFWGNCAEPAPPLLSSIIPPALPSVIAPSPPAPSSADKKPADSQAEPCQKDFWGNCTQMIPTLLSPPAKSPQQESQSAGPQAQCVRDFWGNCTPVASNRHAYRWRYVRPGHRSTMAAIPTPPAPAPSGGERSGGRVDHAGPPVVCHPKRRAIGEEQPTTEQAQLSAEQAWMGSVRYDFGERYQNLAMAKDVRYTCAPSSAKSGLKRAMYRCAAEAMPCRTGGN